MARCGADRPKRTQIGDLKSVFSKSSGKDPAGGNRSNRKSGHNEQIVHGRSRRGLDASVG